MSRARRLMSLFTLVAAPWLLARCGSEPSRIVIPESPTGPSTPQIPTPDTPTPRPDGTLTGVVYEETADGRRPISGARVQVTDLVYGPYEWGWYEQTTNARGEFGFNPQWGPREVKITAYTGRSWSQTDLFQLSLVHVALSSNTSVEIELVRRNRVPSNQSGRRLSGVVFRRTPDGRQPAADLAVMFSSRNRDGADVYGRTDASGRYQFYGLPLMDGYVLPACAGDGLLPPGQLPITVSVDIRGDTALDIDCP